MESRKLFLVRRMDAELPEIPEVAGLKLHGWDDNSGASYEWIMAGAGCSGVYDAENGEVFFAASYVTDVAAVTAVETDGETVEFRNWAIHPWQRGFHYGRYVMIHALCEMAKKGYKLAKLALDADAGTAIHAALVLGFAPENDDEETRKACGDAEKKCAEAALRRPKPMRLWDKEAPYSTENDFQPSMMPYPAEGSRGCVVVCPGGAYCIKASHEGDTIARMLNEAGISAFVLDYRVHPCHYEAPMSDAKRAIRLAKVMGYEKVGIMGFSAGGNLCCSAATLYDEGDPAAEDPVDRISSRPDAFIPCYAVASFLNWAHTGSVQALLGDHAGERALLRRFSAELNVTPDTPPAFIWHTMNDSAVPVQNSLNLASALANAGVPCEMHIFPEGEHGLGVAAGDPVVGKWTGLCREWLLRLGFGRQ